MVRVARIWDPWRQFERLHDEMNRLLMDYARPISRQAGFPAINVWQGKGEIVLTAELPGLSAEDLDVDVTGDSVTISGQWQSNSLKDGETYHRRERPSHSFTRTVELSYEVDPETAEASYEQGVLTIRLQRPESEKPRKVTVKSA